jgi:signal transduction histidine kinase
VFTRDLGESPGMPAVHVAVPSDLPPVDADAQRIGHVLTNLADNARKYGGEGPVTITARRSRGMIVVTVQDTGPGIAGQERSLVFDRFYRGRAARAGEMRGSGLGLYVCRRLIEAHGGRIWVESRPGRGTAFHFTVPRVEPAQLPALASAEGGNERPTAARAGRGRRAPDARLHPGEPGAAGIAGPRGAGR